LTSASYQIIPTAPPKCGRPCSPHEIYSEHCPASDKSKICTRADDQTKHIAYILSTAAKRGKTIVEPTAEGERDWIAQIRAANIYPAEFFASCTPGYYNNEGRGGVTIWDESYAPGVAAFNALLHDWRERGEMAGLELR